MKQFFLLGIFCLSQVAFADTTPGLSITGTSLQQLMNTQITSLSSKEQNVNFAPAAAYIITGDEIQRMGVTQLAETLRYVPGVQVALTGINQWAISIRGFDSNNANKMLVMIDGRTVYTTLFAGVIWEQQDVLLEDIDRIEIIRGPGGTIWGANAVNGIINIITKSAKDTQGLLVKGGYGTTNNLVETRIGGALGNNTFARFFVKAQHQNAAINTPINDDAKFIHTGFRADRYSLLGNMTLSGDVYEGGLGATLDNLSYLLPAEGYQGHNLLFNWTYGQNASGQHQIFLYNDYAYLNLQGLIVDHRTTNNFNYQFVKTWEPQEVTFGVGYRRVNDNVLVQPPFFYRPQTKIDAVYSTFIQDDIAFFKNKAHLILGTKYEHNDYTGSEWEPSVRASYALPRSLLWAAWSRAIRVPARTEETIYFPSLLIGNPHLHSEMAFVTEVGWRSTWPSKIQFEVTGYTSKYKGVVDLEPLNHAANKMFGRISGVELNPSLQVKPNWLIRFNYSRAIANMGVANSSGAKNSNTTSSSNVTPEDVENTLPRDMFQIISMWDINSQWQLNTFLRYVSHLRSQTIPAYIVADASVEWKQTKLISWQVVGRNLGQKHFEWGGATAPYISPSVALYLTIKV